MPTKRTLVSRFGIQRKIVANMTTESWQNIPHVSYIFEPDLTVFEEKFEAFRKTLPEGARVTLNMVILKVIAESLKAAPEMNAHIHFERRLVRGKITRYPNIDMSMPWILPSGEMMTITMKDMGEKSLRDIAEYMNETAQKIQNTNLDEVMYDVSIKDTMQELKKGKIVRVVMRLWGAKVNPRHRVSTLHGAEKKAYESIPEQSRLTYLDLKQGTITVSNIGSITRGQNGEIAMLMIIPPQICAIGISALQKKPRVCTLPDGTDEIRAATVLPMCVCFDHRALDFGNIKPFAERMQELFNDPDEILKY